MSTARAIELLQTDGTHYSGSDWKYGWPHKFYIGTRKFYATHLELCSHEQFAQFTTLSRQLFGVVFGLDERGLWYRAPRGGGFGGWQTWGIVGAERSGDADGRFGPRVPEWILTAVDPPSSEIKSE